MKKITFFAVVVAAMAFTACGGNKSAQTAEETDSIKVFEQELLGFVCGASGDAFELFHLLFDEVFDVLFLILYG